jgi:hypothetical protein
LALGPGSAGQTVGMVEPGGQADLAKQAFRTQSADELWAEHLEGNWSVVLQVPGEPDRRHPAAAELALEHVAVGQGGLEPFNGLGQRDLSD